MANESRLTAIAKQVVDGLNQQVPRVAQRIAPEIQLAGATAMSRKDYLAVWFRNWGDQGFRTLMLKTVGPKAFEADYEEMVKLYGNPLPPPSAPLPGAIVGPQPVGGAPPIPLPPPDNVVDALPSSQPGMGKSAATFSPQALQGA